MEETMRRFVYAVLMSVAIVAAGSCLPGSVRAQPAGQPQPGDPFGQAVVLTAKPILYVAGAGTWDTAFDTLADAFAMLKDYLSKAGIMPAGPTMTIYTAMDDTGF